jgi:hypothetical protein
MDWTPAAMVQDISNILYMGHSTAAPQDDFLIRLLFTIDRFWLVKKKKLLKDLSYFFFWLKYVVPYF